MPHLIAIQ